MEIAILSRQRARRLPRRSLAAFAGRLVASVPATGRSAMTVVLAGDGTLRRLNREFRGKDGTTDVLSFPAGEGRLPDGSHPLGEVVISVPQAARQAKAAGHALTREIRLLLIHGYLHLLGYDHEVDDGTMMRLQRRLARTLLNTRR